MLILECLPAKKTFKRHIFNILRSYGFRMIRAFSTFWFIDNIHVAYNDSIVKKANESFVTISNHVSDFDWLFVHYAAERLGFSKSIFITMKESLRSIFVIGYVLERFDAVFLARKKKKVKPGEKTDLEKLMQKSLEIQKDGYSVNPLLFPEGTYICKETLLESEKFFKANFQIKSYLYEPTRSLLPRINGFQTLLLSQPNIPKGICDITLFVSPYTRFVYDHYPTKELLLNGTPQFNINLLVKYETFPDKMQILINQIKNEGEVDTAKMDALKHECIAFLNNIFQEKERNLEQYQKLERSGTFDKFFKANLNSKHGNQLKYVTGRLCPKFSFIYFIPSVICYILLAITLATILSPFFGCKKPVNLQKSEFI
ncbi:hypothetical protein GINT2_000069 [Glugoides intestinalis]